MPPRPERLLLSSILINGDKSEVIKSGFSPENMVVYDEEMRYLLGLKRVPSIKTFLARYPDFRVSKVPSDDIPELMNLCRNRKIESDLVKSIKMATVSLNNGGNAVNIAERLEQDTRKANNQFQLTGDINAFENIDTFFDVYKEKRERVRKGGTIGIPYGLKTMDKLTGGIMEKELITVAARTSVGKTFLMCNFASNAVMNGYNVMYLSLEMPWHAILSRIITLLSRKVQSGEIDSDLILRNSNMNFGKISTNRLKRVVKKMMKDVSGNLYVPDINGRFSLEHASRKVEQLKPDIMFFDYFGLAVGGDNGKLDNWVQAAEASHLAKSIAMNNNMAVVIGAQLNRGGAQSPTLENIAITDSIGQDSDKVFILTPRGGGKRIVIDCAKQREGKSGWNITTSWNVDDGEIEELRFDDGKVID